MAIGKGLWGFFRVGGPPAMLPPPALTCQRSETNRRDIVKESVCRVNFHLCKSYFRWTRREWNLKMHFRVHNCGTFSHCTIQSNVLRWHQITDRVGDQNGKVWRLFQKVWDSGRWSRLLRSQDLPREQNCTSCVRRDFFSGAGSDWEKTALSFSQREKDPFSRIFWM